MTHYIYDLYKINKVKEMENLFEQTFGVKAVIAIAPCQTKLRIIIVDYLFQFIDAYTFGDYECFHWGSAPFGYSQLMKSERRLDVQEVKNFYFNFMKDTFNDYLQNYLPNSTDEVWQSVVDNE